MVVRKRTVITRGETRNVERGRGLRWAYQSHLTGMAHPRFTGMGVVVTDAGNMTTHANATNEQRIGSESHNQCHSPHSSSV